MTSLNASTMNGRTRRSTCATRQSNTFSTRPYRGLPEVDYPFHDRTVTVTTCGRICFNRQKINLSTVFAGQSVGIKQVSEHIWLVSFMDYDLGYFDHETCRLEPIENPFGPKVLGLSS
jgi:putative transposase